MTEMKGSFEERPMVVDRFTRISTRSLSLLALLLLTAMPLAAQLRAAPSEKDDDREPAGEETVKYPPMKVNPEVFKAADEQFVAIARKIQDGSATTQERR